MQEEEGEFEQTIAFLKMETQEIEFHFDVMMY